MPTKIETDITVQRFGFASDAPGKRLLFPRAETHMVEGRSGSVAYGCDDLLCDGLVGRLDTLRWTADTMSLGRAWLRDDGGRYDISVDRIEMPSEVMVVRAERGVELVSPHVSLHEMRLTVKGPFGRSKPPETTASGTTRLRQDGLRFLDSLTGRIYVTVKVVLDLPVLGVRTLDQELKIPVQEGSIDFRALEDSLDWLEGAFLDIAHEGNRLAITWKVPIVGRERDLIAFTLDDDAQKIASFGRVPVRSLADFVIGSGEKPRSESKKRNILQDLSFQAADIALSLAAPRSFEVGGGLIMFGGDDQPGLVDLEVKGAINANRPGQVSGRIGSIDTTIKDLKMGPARLTADRLHLDGLDELEVTFDGFRPTSIRVVIHRVTATNLALQLG